MNVLFIGDIVGKTGRSAVSAHLPFLKEKYAIDFTIANGENSAHGKGITERIYNDLMNLGIDVITLGNHAFSKADIYQFIERAPRLVRPLNLNPTQGGQGYVDLTIKGIPLRVINLCGSVFMDNIAESPFIAMQSLVESSQNKITIVDIHAEATSEKAAFFQMFRNSCAAVLGTHTHVQTADEQVKDGCAFISDVGMTGPFDSIIGRDIQEVLNRFRGVISKNFTVAEGEAVFSAVILKIDEKTRRTQSIERVQFRPEKS